MDIRQKVECKIYMLIMNGVRCRHEDVDIVATAESAETLIEWHNQQLNADGIWVDDIFADLDGHVLNKAFRKGSNLEPYNPIYDFTVYENTERSGAGIRYEWIPIDSLDQVMNRYNWIGPITNR